MRRPLAAAALAALTAGAAPAGAGDDFSAQAVAAAAERAPRNGSDIDQRNLQVRVFLAFIS